MEYILFVHRYFISELLQLYFIEIDLLNCHTFFLIRRYVLNAQASLMTKKNVTYGFSPFVRCEQRC